MVVRSQIYKCALVEKENRHGKLNENIERFYIIIWELWHYNATTLTFWASVSGTLKCT